MGLVDQHVDVRPRADVRGHVVELVDHRDDDPAIVVPQQFHQPADAVGVLDVLQPEHRQVPQHLIFQFVAVDQQQDGRLLGLRGLEEQFGRLDHRERLAAALRVPYQPAAFLRVESPPDDPPDRFRLVLPKNVLLKLLVLLGENDEPAEQLQDVRDAQKVLIFASSWPACSSFQLKMFRRIVFQVTP